jgi:hypothetical protein
MDSREIANKLLQLTDRPTSTEVKACIGTLLDHLIADGHANHDLHNYSNCQSCIDMKHAYALLGRL